MLFIMHFRLFFLFLFIVILKSNNNLTNQPREQHNQHLAPGPPGLAFFRFCF